MKCLKANWNAPANVSALTTTRFGGVSKPPFDSNNLGLHVGDDALDVLRNREALLTAFHLKHEPYWLNQTHSNRCIIAGEDNTRDADAIISRSSDYPLVIMTADCLPIMLCNQEGSEIAAIHAGWKGLVDGVIENTLKKMHSAPENIYAWIGPSICQNCFEVGDEVFQIYQNNYPFSKTGFQPRNHKWLADLPGIAEMILKENKIKTVSQSKHCTFELKKEYYSYRRMPQTGRMATLLWFNTN